MRLTATVQDRTWHLDTADTALVGPWLASVTDECLSEWRSGWGPIDLTVTVA